MGQTRVDLLHLLEDLRDAYPGELEETILTEIVANSLDSGATHIAFQTDAEACLLRAIDDGSGMSRRELARYHDLAASTKTRGEGIGFAGVGIKLGLLVCEEVLTEARRGASHVATRWRLASRHRAPWSWVAPPGWVAERGTAVGMRLGNPLSPLLDPGYVEATLRRHFQPLLDPAFDEILRERYPKGIALEVDGRRLSAGAGDGRARILVRLPRKRRPSALGFLERSASPLPEERQGLGVSTLGKVIRRGWDWAGLTPASPAHVGGLVEAPGLALALTLSKGDFVRVGRRGMTYLAYRKAVQEAVSAQLAAWGEARGEADEALRRRAARPVERDLETVLVDLASAFPMLAALVERRAGGQRRLAVGEPALRGRTEPAAPEPPGGVEGAPPEAATGQESAAPAAEAVEEHRPTEPHLEKLPPPPPSPGEAALLDAAPRRGPRRPTRYGLAIEFHELEDKAELGRLVESTVWVNTAHPAYRRAVASRSEGYHVALTVGMALAPLAAEPGGAHEFLTAFLARWGDALGNGRRRGRRSRRGNPRRSA